MIQVILIPLASNQLLPEEWRNSLQTPKPGEVSFSGGVKQEMKAPATDRAAAFTGFSWERDSILADTSGLGE